MKVKKTKSIFILNIILILFISGFITTQPTVEALPTHFFTLTFKVLTATPYPDYANLVKQHLAKIGINVDIILEDSFCFGMPCDFDITCLEFDKGVDDFFRLPNAAYRENGSLNCYGYDTTMDYDEELGTGKNEWYIKQGNLIIPPESEARIQLAWDWANYMQDKILPMKPLFAPLEYEAYWNNLIGYNISKGLRQSWGHMSWDGYHPGQSATNEIILTDSAWSELNPFFYSDTASGTITGYCLDTLIDVDDDLSIWPMLVENWSWVDDCTLDITIRDGIKWPDYDEFTDEYLTADDVYFTLYCWHEISVRSSDWFWLDDFEKLDDMTLRLYIDGNPRTPEPDPYAPTIVNLATWIVPEHFLNQTQEIDGITPDITHSSWTDYSTNVWGTDIFKIGLFTENVETILIKSDESWHFDTSLTSDLDLNYIERYGDYSSGLDTLIMRIIPDSQISLSEFEAGKIDLIEPNDPSENKIDQYFADPTKGVQYKTINFFNWIGYNMRESRDYIGSREPCPLDPDMTIGLAIRKAISYAIDRSEINQITHNNKNIIWNHPTFPTFGIWNNPNIIRYNYNIEKAKEYMTKAGFDLGWTERIGLQLPSKIFLLALGIATILYIIKRKKMARI
ncbi:MAG: ABC transporter substrate-binding protein [Asgard group archaeon]|nr:ABC transporter substrate-binding protein [Asgard group archaeon]